MVTGAHHGPSTSLTFVNNMCLSLYIKGGQPVAQATSVCSMWGEGRQDKEQQIRQEAQVREQKEEQELG